MNNAYDTGAYKGVPYYIIKNENYYEWKHLEEIYPAGSNCLMAYGHDEILNDYRLISLDENAQYRNLRQLTELCEKRIETIARNLKEKHPDLDWHTTPAKQNEWIKDKINACSLHDIGALKELLEMAEADFIEDKCFDCLGKRCDDIIYFKPDGKEITPFEVLEYEEYKSAATDWFWANEFKVILPGGWEKSFAEANYPDEHEKGGLCKMIRAEINKLTKKSSGKYVLMGEYATKKNNDELTFNNKKNVEIFIDSLDEAKTMTQFFAGRALVMPGKEAARHRQTRG